MMCGNCNVCGQLFGTIGDGHFHEACDHIKSSAYAQMLEISYDHLDNVGTAFYQKGRFVSEAATIERIEKIYPGHVIKIISHLPPSSYGGLENDGQYTFTMALTNVEG